MSKYFRYGLNVHVRDNVTPQQQQEMGERIEFYANSLVKLKGRRYKAKFYVRSHPTHQLINLLLQISKPFQRHQAIPSDRFHKSQFLLISQGLAINANLSTRWFSKKAKRQLTCFRNKRKVKRKDRKTKQNIPSLVLSLESLS